MLLKIIYLFCCFIDCCLVVVGCDGFVPLANAGRRRVVVGLLVVKPSLVGLVSSPAGRVDKVRGDLLVTGAPGGRRVRLLALVKVTPRLQDRRGWMTSDETELLEDSRVEAARESAQRTAEVCHFELRNKLSN